MEYKIPTFSIDLCNLYWLAGFLEGEGSFRNKNKKRNHPLPTIMACNTDEDVIVHASNLMEVNHYRLERHHGGLGKKPIYRLEVYGPKAHAFMLMLKPLMGSRRQAQINAALLGYDGPHRDGERHWNAKLTDEQAQEIKRLWNIHEYTQKQLGEKFNVSGTHAGRIGRGQRQKCQNQEGER
jgi:hypothetical protein